MIESFLTLRTRIDRFAASIRARYGEQISCKPGCLDCCQAGLTLITVEAVAIGKALGASDERVLLQAGQPSFSEEGMCSFLDNEGLCSIYTHRPIICRTHGYPLKYEEQENISVCDKNFAYQIPHSSVIFDMDNLDAALFAINMDYCRRAGLNPMARVAMDRLASLLIK